MLLLLLSFANLRAQGDCTYDVGYAYSPSVRISAIHFVGDFTLIALEADGGKLGFPVFLQNHGSNPAMLLKTFNAEFPLLDSKGIESYPRVTAVPPGVKKRFLLYFERLPPNVTQFDIVEPAKPVYQGFNFDEVRLSRRKQTDASCRFFDKADFHAYFECCQMNDLEGFYTFSKILNPTKKKEVQTDTAALVFEDGLLRFYNLDGQFLNVEWNADSQSLVFRSKFLKSPALRLTKKDHVYGIHHYKIQRKCRKIEGLDVKRISILFTKLE